MAEDKASMDKKKPEFKKNKHLSLQDRKEQKMKSKKLKQMMKKRLIVRNLSFKVSEDELKKIFSEFGEVMDVNIPLKQDGRKRGFAFVRYKDGKSLIKAMKAMNFKKINGRPVAIDFAVNKITYQSQKNSNQPASEETKNELTNELNYDSDSESEDEDKKSSITEQEKKVINSDEASDDEDIKVKQFLKEFNADEEPEENSDSSENDDSSDDSDAEDNESELSKQDDKSLKHKPKKKQSADVSEGKTVFIRNVSYNTTEEDLKEIMEEYGETVYCLLCVDRITDHSKGSAFVKFKEKESADKLIEASAKEPGVLLDGRKLNCDYALTREELSNKNDSSQKVKDKRNLRLLKCGLILYDSEEAAGVSQTDMAKRSQLEMVKKKKLRNVNFFVSDKRLAIHNLPKNVTDKDLRIMFKKAAGKGAVIKEARVMKDFTKTDSQGIPVSRGFGFVSFTEHEHALKALEELNNNPNIFTASKRPIVEFSVENKVALLSQERKKEKLKQLHKRKLEEKQMSNNQGDMSTNQKESQSSSYNFKIHGKNKKSDNRPPRGKKRKLSSFPEQLSQEIRKQTSKKSKKKNQKTKKRKENTMNPQEKSSLSVLTNKYKEKLLNIIS